MEYDSVLFNHASTNQGGHPEVDSAVWDNKSKKLRGD